MEIELFVMAMDAIKVIFFVGLYFILRLFASDIYHLRHVWMITHLSVLALILVVSLLPWFHICSSYSLYMHNSCSVVHLQVEGNYRDAVKLVVHLRECGLKPELYSYLIAMT